MVLFGSGRVIETEGFPFGISYLVFLSCNILAFISILSVRPLLLNKLANKSVLTIMAALLIFSGTLMTAGASWQFIEGKAWLVVASAMTGVGDAWLILMWGEALGSIESKRTVVLIPFSFFVAIVLYFMILSAPEIVAICITALLPVLSLLLLMAQPRVATGGSSGAAVQPEQLSYGGVWAQAIEQAKIKLPWKLFFGMAIYGCVFGLVRGLATPLLGSHVIFDETNRVLLLGGGIAALLFTLAALWALERLNLTIIYRFVLPSVAAGLLLLPLLGNNRSIVAAAVVMAAYVCFNILIWMLLTLLAHSRGEAMRFFGWGLLASNGGMLAGSQLSYMYLFQTQSAIPLSTISLVIIFALVLTTTFVLNERDLFKNRTTSPTGSLSVVSIDEVLSQKCEQLANTYRLSKREKAVLLLLVKGRSLPYIQKSLYISKGTASSHTEHIYKKLGVHTRQELLDLFESSNLK
jgi:DNA-binding CsgD family transcriptional regulator